MLFTMAIHTHDAGIKVAELTGRLTFGKPVTDVEEQLKEVVAEKPNGVIIDLTGLDLLDSAGVGALVTIISTAREQGVPLRVAGCKERTRNVLYMTQVNQLVVLLPDVQSAIASLGQASGA